MSQRRTRPGTRRGRTARPGRLLRAVTLILQVLGVCLALQMSGVVHFAVDLLMDDQAAAEHFSGGPGEDDEEDCPPGCPTCHCVHPGSALPVAFEGLASTLLPAFEVAWTPYEARTPPSLAPPSVYRPPRA